MLVLTRRENEEIFIGEGEGRITIRVLHQAGAYASAKKVRLGIDAPKHINIVRAEIVGKPRKEEKHHVTR